VPIYEVAKLSGYSNATVSRVLNGSAGVSEQAASEVRKAIEKLGYNRSDTRRGRKLKKRAGLKHDTIALLMVKTHSTLVHAPVSAAVLHTVEKQLAKLGVNLIVSQVHEGDRLPKSVLDGKVDGLLLHGFSPWPSLREQLERFPSVWLLSQREEDGSFGSRVSPDNFAIGHTAARYLIDLGHKRLAYVNTEPGHYGFGLRLTAFRSAAEVAGVHCDILNMETPSLRGVSHEASQQLEPFVDMLLSENSGATGIFVPRDTSMVLLHRLLQRRGVDLADEDIDLISCDNDPVLSGLNPLPATIDLNTEQIGREAVSLLLKLINGEVNRTVRHNLFIQPRLVRPEDQPTYLPRGRVMYERKSAGRPV